MRIKNKHIRNRSFKIKYWKRIRNKSHPFRTTTPTWRWSNDYYSSEKQTEDHFKYINEKARMLESGNHSGRFHATSQFKRVLNDKFKAEERAAMNKLRNSGDYENYEFPVNIKDADWLYF